MEGHNEVVQKPAEREKEKLITGIHKTICLFFNYYYYFYISFVLVYFTYLFTYLFPNPNVTGGHA